MDIGVELEEEGQGVLQMIFLVAFFVILVGIIMGINKVGARSIFASNAENVSKEVESEEYLESYVVQVSAEVPNFLGAREISATPKEVTYMVFGNYERGFLAVDPETGRLLFTYDKIPGDGVMFKASRVYKNIYLTPNY